MSERRFKVWFSDCEAGVGKYLLFGFTPEGMSHPGMRDELIHVCNQRATMIIEETDAPCMIWCSGEGVPSHIVKQDLLDNELRQ